mmetsp:Transcript_11432/g.29176  ORF Transcript_11432/g.29176 Transcript_11432/m.29176 type:complete len:223 (-) Transcript_11432:3580-4248(-)
MCAVSSTAATWSSSVPFSQNSSKTMAGTVLGIVTTPISATRLGWVKNDITAASRSRSALVVSEPLLTVFAATTCDGMLRWLWFNKALKTSPKLPSPRTCRRRTLDLSTSRGTFFGTATAASATIHDLPAMSFSFVHAFRIIETRSSAKYCPALPSGRVTTSMILFSSSWTTTRAELHTTLCVPFNPCRAFTSIDNAFASSSSFKPSRFSKTIETPTSCSAMS